MASRSKTIFFTGVFALVIISISLSKQDSETKNAHRCLGGELLKDIPAPVARIGPESLRLIARRSLKDPSSFKEIATQIFPVGQPIDTYQPDPGHSIAAMVYSGENAFGATRQEEIVAEIDPVSCETIRVLSQHSR